MNEHIDADDLAMLAKGFEVALASAPGAGEAGQALFELGWVDLLHASPHQAAATAFTALGLTGSAAGILDDVVAHALGLEVAAASAVVFPRPGQCGPAAIGVEDHTVVDGLVSARIDTASVAVVAIALDDATAFASVEASLLCPSIADGIDPGYAYRRVTTTLDNSALTPIQVGATWEVAVAVARVALAHQLIASARWMLDQARQHSIDRVQFGRSIASFQAVRHKLAEAYVQIEGAASVASAAVETVDPLLAAVAKSLAGAAARTAATHTQQVLAGIGFTTDHQFHRWLKRMLVIDTLFGSASSLPTEIGHHLLELRTAPRLLEL